MTEPSHQAMLRTSIAPTQPTTPTSGSASASRTRRAEVGIDDLGVLVDEHERLEVVAPGGLVEQRVVAREQIEPIEGMRETSESGSAARRMPGSAQRR